MKTQQNDLMKNNEANEMKKWLNRRKCTNIWYQVSYKGIAFNRQNSGGHKSPSCHVHCAYWSLFADTWFNTISELVSKKVSNSMAISKTLKTNC